MSLQLELPGLARSVRLPAAPRSDALADFPAVSSGTLCRHAKTIGRAGELLVDSLLTRYGELVLSVPEDQPFDRLISRGDRPARLQVKTAARPCQEAFRFTMQKGYRGSPHGTQLYAPDDYDIAALVALSENVVYFTAEKRSSYRLDRKDLAALRADPLASYRQALAEFEAASAAALLGT